MKTWFKNNWNAIPFYAVIALLVANLFYPIEFLNKPFNSEAKATNCPKG